MATGIDWAAIEARQGIVVLPDQRVKIEVDVLRAETEALVNQARHVEDCHESRVEEIKAAAAEGKTHEQYTSEQYDAAFPADCDEL